MSAEFNWWLLIVGLIAGGALTWLVLADSTRREREIGDEELAAEAAWIARALQRETVDGDVARDVLQAHRRYLGFPPPDALVDPDELAPGDDLASVGGSGPGVRPAGVSTADDGASSAKDHASAEDDRASSGDDRASGNQPSSGDQPPSVTRPGTDDSA